MTHRTRATNLTDAQRCSIATLQKLRPLELDGPFEMYPGAEHPEVVWMELRGRNQDRDHRFMVALGGCVTEMLG